MNVNESGCMIFAAGFFKGSPVKKSFLGALNSIWGDAPSPIDKLLALPAIPNQQTK